MESAEAHATESTEALATESAEAPVEGPEALVEAPEALVEAPIAGKKRKRVASEGKVKRVPAQVLCSVDYTRAPRVRAVVMRLLRKDRASLEAQ